MYQEFYNPISGELTSIIKTTESEVVSMPIDPANRHYAEYLRWLEEGNEPLPADEPPTE